LGFGLDLDGKPKTPKKHKNPKFKKKLIQLNLEFKNPKKNRISDFEFNGFFGLFFFDLLYFLGFGFPIQIQYKNPICFGFEPLGLSVGIMRTFIHPSKGNSPHSPVYLTLFE
jgi:hypothetical protein